MTKKSKKIIWISSYLPRADGIAYYSSNYIRNLKKYIKNISIKIVSHKDCSEADYPLINLRDKNWIRDVFEIIKKEKPDIVHIQHEYGLYETYDDNNKTLLGLIKMLKKEKFKVVITYHTIFKKLESFQKNFVSESLKEIDVGIFHEQYQKDFLKANIGWNPSNVYILPHGSEEVKIDKKKIRKDFGYGNKLIVGSAGLADKRKGFPLLIKQWDKVIKKFPNAFLVLRLKPHFDKETRDSMIDVLNAIIKSPVYKKIEFSVKNYSDFEFYKRLTCFDVLVLPYKSESQSGVLAHGFSVGVPAIVTDIEGLGAEIKNSNAGIAVKNRKNFYKYIIKMLSSKDLRKKYSENALKYVKNVSSWKIISEKTNKIYEKIISWLFPVVFVF